MYALVKFNCDNFTCVVPAVFIKDFSATKKYKAEDVEHVFWSPNPDDTPDSILKKEGQILYEPEAIVRKKKHTPLPGFYAASVLFLAESEEELNEKADHKSSRQITKKITAMSDPGCSKEKDTTVSIKKAKLSGAAASLSKLKKNIDSIRKQKSIKSVFESSSDESENNMEDENRSKIEENQEAEKWRNKYKNLKIKYGHLKEKCEKLTSLNFKYQEDSFNMDGKTGDKRKKGSPEKAVKKKSLDVIIEQPISKGDIMKMDVITKQFASKEDMKITDECSLNILPPPISTLDIGMQENSCSISEEKLSAAYVRVKPGEAGDSVFAKNLAVVIFGSLTLMNSSVTGSRCLAKKESTPKPPLEKEKMELLTELFVKRIKEENPTVLTEEINKRSKKIRLYLSEKICTLNRVQKTNDNVINDIMKSTVM